MKHFVPIDTGNGWGVCYRNWRGEYVPVIECGSFDVAYDQAAKLTQQAVTETVTAQLIADQAQQRARAAR